MKRKITVLIILFAFSFEISAQNYQFTIYTDKVTGKNTEFWKAGGSDHLFYHVLKPSGQALLDRMQQSQSHKYLRSHHTLSGDIKHGVPRGQEVYSEDEHGNPIYDFSKINEVYHEYVKRGIKPIVEYDYMPALLKKDKYDASAGNDEGMEMSNAGPKDWIKWSALMKALTQNFIEEFGATEVETWYFEVWNEPDGWPIEQLDTFFKMYDVFVDAVTSVNPKLKVGGPAAYHEYFLRPFLNHCVNDTNHVTGKKGTRIDFISYHIYGLSGSWLNKQPKIQPQVQRFTQSILWLKRLMSEFESLKGTEFHINEWGLSSNYFRTVNDYPDLNYRNSEESPLFMAKLVNSLYQIEDNHKFPISMLLYWGFCWESDEDEFFVGKRELTTAGDIPKPIQTGFEIMAKLQTNRLKVKNNNTPEKLGILATKSESDQISFLAYNYNETAEDLLKTEAVEVELSGLKKNQSFVLKETLLDSEHNNTYNAWLKAGKPTKASGNDISQIRSAANLKTTVTHTFKSDESGNAKIKLILKEHSMVLLEIE